MFFDSLFEARLLKKENEKLLFRNLTLLKEILSLKNIQQENKALRQALNLREKREFELSLVELISKETGRDFILVDGGKNQGISENMPVITENGVLVGKTKEVFSDFSEVILITAQKSVFDIEIQNEENSLGIARGKGNLRIEFELVLKENKIEQGDIVQTTSLGGNFPKGLLVGEIEEIRKSETDPYQEGVIRAYFRELKLRQLFIIKNFKVLE